MSQFNAWTRLQAYLQTRLCSQRGLILSLASVGLTLGGFAVPGSAQESEFAGLIRGKMSDRSIYQPPTLIRKTASTKLALDELETVDFQEFPDSVDDIDGEPESREPESRQPESGQPELNEPEAEEPTLVRSRVRQIGHQSTTKGSRVSQAAHGQGVVHEEYGNASYPPEASCGLEPSCGFEPVCGCEAVGYACDGSCMSGGSGCDSCGSCGGCSACGTCGCGFGRPRLSLDPCQWFGAVEVMLMSRVGDDLPILATTTPTGILPGAATLFGGQKVLDDVTAGGRITIGTWLDNQQCRSLVFRGWGAEQDSFSFSTNEVRNPLIARPFFNVTDNDNLPDANDAQIIARPAERNGSIDINGENHVYGADASLRHRWLGGMGGFVDVLFGYQYLQMEDRLRIATSSTVIAEGLPPRGTIINVADSFDAENQFHGAQLGLATRYREGCFSFNGLAKIAGGGLLRSVQRTGVTNTSNGGNNAPPVPTGLLVRSTNDGKLTDDAFGWVPEVDLSLGWQWTKNLDLTIGYNFIALTDSLQVSGAIDPNLSVNAADNPTGLQRPRSSLEFDTYYIHGIHFGLQCVY